MEISRKLPGASLPEYRFHLAWKVATRALLGLAAFQWRKLAEKAAERQKTREPWASKTMSLSCSDQRRMSASVVKPDSA